MIDFLLSGGPGGAAMLSPSFFPPTTLGGGPEKMYSHSLHVLGRVYMLYIQHQRLLLNSVGFLFSKYYFCCCYLRKLHFNDFSLN